MKTSLVDSIERALAVLIAWRPVCSRAAGWIHLRLPEILLLKALKPEEKEKSMQISSQLYVGSNSAGVRVEILNCVRFLVNFLQRYSDHL